MNCKDYRKVCKYFVPQEFENCVPPCTIKDMDGDFLLRLDLVRAKCGFPLKLNSAYRSKDYELSKGRSGTSSHTKGLAVDIACNDSTRRMAIVQSALDCGITRIGIADTFLHLDYDIAKPQNVLWTY